MKAIFLLFVCVICHAEERIAYMVSPDEHTYYVHAAIGDANRKFLLDTGASFVVLSDLYVKNMQKVDTMDIQYADGRSVTLDVYHVPSMIVGTCEIKDIKAVHIPGSSMNILGNTALEKLSPILFDFENRKLILNC